ncbi:TPA: TonB-dependent siderophore receptor [Kluyvera ascorbata]|uniref:TonB-dependent siderophore receptor n=2 Tax=Enterobacterales TaxID=91347 RepID=A0A2T2Y243_9ENTR|nr:TonB-dependent siderophore receptor [Kluyvera genomosp. 2]BBQ83639.1 TonB-dependent receptor [Klebsiella sp. WP3-W18-ESBL-02]BBR20659.1 TonB-dependent receptor [Klebsiella sp. WP3-S18-ESBL-05]HAT3918308.1 TonB-dependent siderophore receptor [Kluyvera ascorbata]HAT3943221.1 TonB-dependent siderophore receptor [Kluyvera ascorbata]
MTQLSPTFTGTTGRALFSLLFLGAVASPSLMAAEAQPQGDAAKKEESMTVVGATAQADRDVTDGYQPLSSSTATLTSMPMLDIPQVVNTVSDRVLADQHATSLDEALYNVANVVQTNTLGGTQDAFTRRGFGANRDGSIMTNGLRTVLPRSFNAATSRVEVLKGPASTLYGILDPGGLINVVTKRPERTFSGDISATSSSFGGGTGQIDVTGPIDGTRLTYRLVGEYQNEDYWRSFGQSRSSFIAPSLTWFGDDATVNLSWSHRNYNTPFDRGTIFDLNTGQAVNVPSKERFDEPFNITDGNSDLAQLNAEYRLNSQWTARFDYSFSQDMYSDNQARVMAYDAKTGDLTRRVDATQGSTQRMHATRADLQGNVVIGGFYNELLTGIAYENYDLLRTDMIRCKNVKKSLNIYNPVYGTLDKCTTVSAADSDQRIQQETYATYLQDALYLTDKWIAVAGVRYQYYTQYAGKGRPFQANTDSQDEKLTPKFGLVYKLSPQVSLFGNVAQSFMPQSSIASYIGDLPPEEATSYEVGAKFDLFDGVTSNVTFFDIHKRNVLYTETIGDETYAKTAGKVRSRGIEVDVAGSLTDNLNIIGSYGYTDAKVLEDPDYAGKPLPNVPRHTGSLFLTYDIHNVYDSNTLTVGGGGHALSRRSGTNGADYYLPGYAVADVFAAYKMKLQYPVTLQVNVKNLFNKTYYTSSIASNNLGNQIGDPREVQFTVKMSF